MLKDCKTLISFFIYNNINNNIENTDEFDFNHRFSKNEENEFFLIMINIIVIMNLIYLNI